MWFDKYYHGKVPNVYKKKTELVKLEAEKYNLQQEYQKFKENVKESRKRGLESRINVRNNNKVITRNKAIRYDEH